MHLTAHHHAVLKVLAVAAAVMAGAPSQAALTNLTLDSGLQVSQDAATGLLWRSFDDAAAGAQAGFRQATAADFNTLLRNNGYTATGALPSGLMNLGTAPIVITPEVSQTTTTQTFVSIDGTDVPQAFLLQQADYQAGYERKLVTLAGLMTPEEILRRYYTNPVIGLEEQYGVYSQTVTETKIITPAVIVMQPALVSGGLSASYYSTAGTSAISVAGTHRYDNNVSYAESHNFFMGQVSTDDGYWVGATTDNYVPHQCSPGDAGFSGYGYGVQYCGGTSSTYAYLGPSQFTEFNPSNFSHADYGTVKKPMGYLMVQSVPEPATYALMGLGLVGLAWVRGRRHTSA